MLTFIIIGQLVDRNQSGREGEREGDVIAKGPKAGTRPRDAHSTTALYKAFVPTQTFIVRIF